MKDLNSAFENAISNAHTVAGREFKVIADNPTHMVVENVSQGVYVFTNSHGVSGEILEVIHYNEYDIEQVEFMVETSKGYTARKTYKEARNYASLLK